MLYLFDLDGTLITSYMDNPDRDFHTWEPLPRRGYKLAELRQQGHTVGIVTNQAGVAWGFVTEADWEHKIADVCHRLRLDWEAVYVCFADARSRDARYNDPAQIARRKPSGAVIREAMAHCGYGPADVLFVGDRSEDEAAAQDAGVSFQWAHAFFGDQ